jgi:hypothetical protein
MRAFLALLVGIPLWGCAMNARSPEQYREATAQVLAAHNDQLRACYEQAHKGDPTAEGTVSIHFNVEPETGKFVHARVVGGSAPDSVKRCVLQAVEGNVLSPADKREGDATFDWEFVPPKPPPV